MTVNISCMLATVLFTTGNILRIVYFVQERKREHWDWDLYTEFDIDYLQSEWGFRMDQRGLYFASNFFNAFGWFFFAMPVCEMAWVLSHRGTRAIMYNISIMVLAIGGAMTEWLSNLFWIGMTVAGETLATDFNLDNWVRDDVAAGDEGLGWKSLEVNHIVGSGFIWYVDAFEWVCLTGIFVSTFCSVRLWRREDGTTFGARWNALSLFIGLLCILEFTADILRFEGFRTFGSIALVYAMLNRLILIPAWLISLGFVLPQATLKQAYADSNPIAAELALAELASAMDTDCGTPGMFPKATDFSIDDDEANGHGGETNGNGPMNPSSPPPEAFSK